MITVTVTDKFKIADNPGESATDRPTDRPISSMSPLLVWLVFCGLQQPLLVRCGCIDVNREVLMNQGFAPSRSGPFSFEMWFKLLSPPIAGASVIQFDQNSFSIHFSSANASVLEGRLAGETLLSDVVLGANEWIHVAARASQTDFTFDDDSVFYFQLSVDGRSTSDTMIAARWSAAPVRVRLCSNGMRCLIDYVRVWASDRFLLADARAAFQTNAIVSPAGGNLHIDARFDVEELGIFTPSLAKNEWVEHCRARHVYARPRGAMAVASNEFPSECEWAQTIPDVYQSGMYGSATTVGENRFLFDATSLFVRYAVVDGTRFVSNELTNNADSGEMLFPTATAGVSFDLIVTPNFAGVAGGGPADGVRSQFTATGWLAVVRLPWTMFNNVAIGPTATTIDALFCVNDRENATARLHQFDHAAARNFMGGFDASRTAWGTLNLLTNATSECSLTLTLPQPRDQSSSAVLSSWSRSSSFSFVSGSTSTSNAIALPLPVATTQTLAVVTNNDSAETSAATIGGGIGIAVAVLILLVCSIGVVVTRLRRRQARQTPPATTDVVASSPPNDHYYRAHPMVKNDLKTYSTLAPHEV
jgi:hypothetical protein